MNSNLKKEITVLFMCLIIIFAISFLPFLKSYAQILPSLDEITGNSVPDITGIQEEVELNVNPQHPQPGQTVNAFIEAPGLDLNNSQISWYVNGSLKTSGVGAKTFTTQAGQFGKSTIILVKISPSNGATAIEKSFIITAQDVDVIWEAGSYVPPFYKGRALYGQEGNVNFVAIPKIINKSGVLVNPSNLIYEWSIDGDVIGEKSGYGKNSLFYSGSLIGRQNLVSVKVTAADGTTGEGNALIAPRSPITILYESDPLYGILFNRAVGDGYKLKSKEIRLDAYPYFFSTGGKTSSNISYTWFINEQAIPVPIQKNSALFRNSNSLNGTSKISVGTSNNAFVLQRSETNVLLNF